MSAQVAAWLQQRHVNVKPQWLAQTVSRLQAEGFQGAALCQQVFQVWTNADIHETCAVGKGLTGDGSQLHNQQIGPVALQIVSSLNIGESAFSQYNRIEQLGPSKAKKVPAGVQNQQRGRNQNRGQAKKNEEEALPPGYHVMKLIFTDGHQKIPAMEYKHMPQLTPDMPPGTKVVVRKCRIVRGILLLEPGSVDILGGKVDVLTQGYSHKSVLEQRLSDLKRDPASATEDSSEPPNLVPSPDEISACKQRLAQLKRRFEQYRATAQPTNPPTNRGSKQATQSKFQSQEQPQPPPRQASNRWGNDADTQGDFNQHQQQSTQPFSFPQRPQNQSRNPPNQNARFGTDPEADLDFDFPIDDMDLDDDILMSENSSSVPPPQQKPQPPQQQQRFTQSINPGIANFTNSTPSTQGPPPSGMSSSFDDRERQRLERLERQRAKQAEIKEKLGASQAPPVKEAHIPSPFFCNPNPSPPASQQQRAAVERPLKKLRTDESLKPGRYVPPPMEVICLDSDEEMEESLEPVVTNPAPPIRTNGAKFGLSVGNQNPLNRLNGVGNFAKNRDEGVETMDINDDDFDMVTQSHPKKRNQNPVQASNIQSDNKNTFRPGSASQQNKNTIGNPIAPPRPQGDQRSTTTIGRNGMQNSNLGVTGKDMPQFTFLSRLSEHSPPCHVFVQAYLMQIAEKLDRKALSVVAEFDDGTARTKVLLDSEILLTMLPFESLEDYHRKRQEDNKAVSQTFRELNKQLIMLECVLYLDMQPGAKYPRAVRMETPGVEHARRVLGLVKDML